jgi:hypothetical protein
VTEIKTLFHHEPTQRYHTLGANGKIKKGRGRERGNEKATRYSQVAMIKSEERVPQPGNREQGKKERREQCSKQGWGYIAVLMNELSEVA